MNSFLKIFSAIVLVCLLSATNVHAERLTATEQTVLFMSSLIEEDLITYLSTPAVDAPTLFQIKNTPRIEFSINASAITKEFDSNELKAEKKYGDTLFDVSGKVVGVKRDTVGRAYVEFQTSKHGITNSIAYLTLYGANKASDYENGQTIKLRCKSAKKSLVVTMQSCQEMPPVEEEAKKTTEKLITKFFLGEDISSLVAVEKNGSPAKFLFNIAFISNNFELDKNCLSPKTIGNCRDFKKLPSDPFQLPSYKAAYEENKEFYHLP